MKVVMKMAYFASTFGGWHSGKTASSEGQKVGIVLVRESSPALRSYLAAVLHGSWPPSGLLELSFG